ncbi:phospholipase SGR2 isoform X2 [Silene latifolia]|uniref:phospholipase SGR2 isoform X2 n=1 Tax=Silene latifolia TaxID=37657 RepID=UPI003D772190
MSYLVQVDLAKRHCFPVYWNGENRRVLRGHWFAQSGGLDWLPLREDVAEQLEIAYRRQIWHRRTFQPSGLFAARVDLQGSTQGLHALFTGEDPTWEAWLNVDASGFSGIVNLGGNGIKLRRGYAASPSPKPTQDELRQQKEEEMDDYCSQVPVRHLVFMVHGIGQRLEKSNLVDDVTNFRHITSSLAEKHLTSYQRGIQRVLYIPCQWRKGLKFSGESAVEKITLDGVRGLRTTLSATVHDVLYYMSPIYCQEIIDSVSNQLNRLYLKFLKRNPGYDGKVSLYGHSLGSVLSYDILCHQEKLSSPFPMDCLFRKQVRDEEPIGNVSKLSSQAGDCESKTLQESQHVPAGFENEDAKNSHPIIGVCNSTISSSGIKSFGEAPNTTRDTLEDTPNVDGVLQSNVSENVAGDKSLSHTGDKDMDTIALKSKLEYLEGRVMELEAQLGRTKTRGNDDVHPNVLDQDESMKIQAALDDSPMGYRPFIKYTKLEFKVDTFFAVGSPLGVFLAIRNVRIGIGEGGEYWGEENVNEEMPACQRMFNIFHPFDPVAYRIEPLVCKEYVSKRPVIVPYHRGGKRLHIGFQDFAEDLASRSQSIVNHLNSVRVQVLTVCQSRKQDRLEEPEEDESDEKRSYGSYMIERLTGSEEERIDHVLQDKTFQHSYISAIGAHTNYWRDLDTALFMLKHLYRDIPDDPEQPNMHRRESKVVGVSASWSDSKTIEEELPLTFSGNSPKITKNAIKNFW